MAIYTTEGFYSAFISGLGTDVFFIAGFNPLVLSLDDGGDEVFSLGEIVVAGNSYTYRGSFSIDGVPYPLFSRNGADNDSFLFVDSATVNSPPTNVPVPYSQTDFANCFAAGTMIETPLGAVCVEDLNIGDKVTTAEGRAVAVKWVGRQSVRTFFSAPHMQPVRIRAGALGHGLPHTDLTVTADHGMVIDGLVINASALVNGDSIDWVPMAELPDVVTYYHVETEDHDVILANGAPAETFIDYLGRKAFDNYQEYLDLYGAERIIHEMTAPRISAARLVPEGLRQRLGGADVGQQDVAKAG